TPTSIPASRRGSLDATRTAAAWSPPSPISRRRRSAAPMPEVPWVTWTRLTTMTAATAIPNTTPTRTGRTGAWGGSTFVAVAMSTAVSRRSVGQGVDQGGDELLHRKRPAEHPDPVGQAVDVSCLDEGQALPDRVALEAGDGVFEDSVGVVGEDQIVGEVGEALDVGDDQSVVRVSLEVPGVYQYHLLADLTHQ